MNTHILKTELLAHIKDLQKPALKRVEGDDQIDKMCSEYYLTALQHIIDDFQLEKEE